MQVRHKMKNNGMAKILPQFSVRITKSCSTDFQTFQCKEILANFIAFLLLKQIEHNLIKINSDFSFRKMFLKILINLYSLLNNIIIRCHLIMKSQRK